MTEIRQKCVTLTALFDLLRDEDHVFILHRMGPHECKGVAAGTARELRSIQFVKTCGNSVIEKLWLETDDWPEVRPGTSGPSPLLVVVIGKGA